MKKTKHAIIRSQQRGIKNNHIDLIVEHGTVIRKPGNVIEFRLFNKDKTKAKHKAYEEYKGKIQDIDKCGNKGVLVDPESDAIITVYIIRRRRKSGYPDLAA